MDKQVFNFGIPSDFLLFRSLIKTEKVIGRKKQKKCF